MTRHKRAPSALSDAGAGERVIVWRDEDEIRVMSRLDADAGREKCIRRYRFLCAPSRAHVLGLIRRLWACGRTLRDVMDRPEYRDMRLTDRVQLTEHQAEEAKWV